MSDTEQIRAHLREVEEDLARLRREIGPPTDDPKDFGDAGADMIAREEQAALIESLEAKRGRLLQQLGD